MKLKTLKDLSIQIAPMSEYNTTIIRQEAIKWIKELKVESFVTNPQLTNKELTNSKALTIKWIEHFFNITEEDLKEKGLYHQKNNKRK